MFSNETFFAETSWNAHGNANLRLIVAGFFTRGAALVVKSVLAT